MNGFFITSALICKRLVELLVFVLQIFDIVPPECDVRVFKLCLLWPQSMNTLRSSHVFSRTDRSALQHIDLD